MKLIGFASLERVLTLQYTHVIFFDYQIFCWPWSEKGNEEKGRKKKERKTRRWNNHNTRVIKASIKGMEKTISGANGEISNYLKVYLEKTTLKYFMLLLKRA